MQTANTQDLTQGNIWKQIWIYAMPMVVSSLLQALYSIVDTIIVGQFVGSEGISAINNSGQILNIITKVAIGMATGGNIIISQYFGAKEEKKRNQASGTLFTLSMGLGFAVAVGLYLGAVPLLSLLGAPSMQEAIAYLQIGAIGMIPVFGYNALAAVLRGVGNSKTPLHLIITSTITNTILDLVFVGAFDMGVTGAALATTISQFLCFGLAWFVLAAQKGLMEFTPSFLKIRMAMLKIILRLGIPSALQMTIAGFSWLVVTFLINQYGVDVSAGNGISVRIKDLCQLFITAMTSGATTMIAQNLGACKYDRAKKIMDSTMKVTITMAIASILLVQFLAPQMAGLFSNEQPVIDAAVWNLRIEIFAQIFYAIFMVYHSLAIGAGHSIFAMLSSFCNCIIFRVVLAVLFNHFFGLTGIYAACAIAPVVSVPLGWMYFKSNVWQRSLAAEQTEE